MIKEIRWKFVMGFSIAAMILSTLSAGLAGIPFGILLLRVFISGIIFAVIALILDFLTAWYLPELRSFSISGSPDQESPGSRVNILAGDSDDEGLAPMENLGDDSETMSASRRISDQADPLLDRSSLSGTSSMSKSASKADPIWDKYDPEDMAKAVKTVISRSEKG